MPNTISRYILQRVLVYLFAMTGLALLALLLERMIRVMGIITNWEGGVAPVARMMLNLVPHYLVMALPAPFFFGVLLTFHHMHRTGELAVLQASGLGLMRRIRPVNGLARILLLALLLERMIRVMGIITNWEGGVALVARMMLNLVPHYLGMALPAAFFFGVLLTFNHMNRNGELAVLQASGLGLMRLLRPVIGLALILAAIAAVTFGYLQPYGRYTYRSIAHDASHVTLGSSVLPGKFFHTDDMTFMAERVSPSGTKLEGIFVYERGADGGVITTTEIGRAHV